MKKSLLYNFKYFLYNHQYVIFSLFSIFLLLLLIFNIIPSLFLSLFHTFFGNIILILSILLVSIIFSISIGIILGLIYIILYFISNPNPTSTLLFKESFWTPESADTFLRIQNTINRNKYFDLSVIQKQASQKEVDNFNKHNMWPWSQDIKDLFIYATNKNTYIRSYPPDSMIQARTIYNENAIKQILSNKIMDRGIIYTPLDPDLSGFGSFAIRSGLKSKKTNPKSIIIRKDPKTGGLEKIKFLGYGGILGEHVLQVSPFKQNSM